MIGVFDSGFGGLTILKELRQKLASYDFVYLGDNARSPYGNRSFDTILEYTRQAVDFLFAQGCELVILACNTASARALRSLQQNWLPQVAPQKRILGVIRPLSEDLGAWSKSAKIGILGTSGTVKSQSYPLELAKFWPGVQVFQQACPLLVPLIENGEVSGPGAEYFVRKYTQQLMAQAPQIDVVALACTHYPLLLPLFRDNLASHIKIVEQGPLIATKTQDYLRRHPEIEQKLTQNGKCIYYTTDESQAFDSGAADFLGSQIKSSQVSLG